MKSKSEPDFQKAYKGLDEVQTERFSRIDADILRVERLNKEKPEIDDRHPRTS